METKSSHSVGGTSNFIALFQGIYIMVGNILSRSCTKSVTVFSISKMEIFVEANEAGKHCLEISCTKACVRDESTVC